MALCAKFTVPNTLVLCTLDAIFVGESRPFLKSFLLLAGVVYKEQPTLTN